MKLYVNLSKCGFWLVKMSSLGHVISDESVFMDPSEVDAVLQWETPKSVNEIRNFLGLVGWYYRLWKALLS